MAEQLGWEIRGDNPAEVVRYLGSRYKYFLRGLATLLTTRQSTKTHIRKGCRRSELGRQKVLLYLSKITLQVYEQSWMLTNDEVMMREFITIISSLRLQLL